MNEMTFPQKHDPPNIAQIGSTRTTTNDKSGTDTTGTSSIGGRDDHDHQRDTKPSCNDSNQSSDDKIIHPQHIIIGRRPRSSGTENHPHHPQQQHPQQQHQPIRPCGPHPSQIRVVRSPIQNNHPHDMTTGNDEDDDAASLPVTLQQQKPVVLCLPSSPLRHKAPSSTLLPVPTTTHPKNNMTSTRHMGLPPTPTSPSVSLLQLPFLYTSPLNSLQQLLSIPSNQPQSLSSSVVHNNNNNNDCDYDQSPTELYQLIEQKQWKRILQQFEEEDDDDDEEENDEVNERNALEKNSANDSIDPPEHTKHSLSLRRQASMWMVRKESNGRLKWRILPLHAAILFRAPHSVIDVLLQCYPISARQKDDQGMIPLHLAMKNFNVQYNHHHHNHNHHGLLHPTMSETTPQWSNSRLSPQPQHLQQQESSLQWMDTMITLWRTVEELLTAFPSGIFSRDRKGRTPLQLGIQTVKKNYDANTNNQITTSSNGTNRSTIALQQQKQQQEMMLAALSVLERYETIYSTTMGDRNTGTTATDIAGVARGQPPPPPTSPQRSSVLSILHPPSSIDEGLEYDEERGKTNLSNSTILSMQQQHLETLQTIRTMFQKQRQKELMQHQQQQAALQEQLNDSINREHQLQIELDNIRHQLQEQLQLNKGTNLTVGPES